MGNIVPFSRLARVPIKAQQTSTARWWPYIFFGAILIGFVGTELGPYLKTPPSASIGANFDPKISPSAIQVIDGDTISARGQTIRLVGFDTPEAGSQARCQSERALASRAASRLRQLVAAGGLDLSLVPCGCPQGTPSAECNHGRACGVLKVNGSDVGAVLIREGLAKPYYCTRSGCPKREPWCS